MSKESSSYQTEADLERELIADLQNQGYEYLSDLNNPTKMLANVREQLQKLNAMKFLEDEWLRFVPAVLGQA
ncbi:MAG: type I restriction endonuclease [Sulfurimonas sp.]|nr:type I restriction endonuclease [Sulfurimonas sp.]